MEYGVIAIVAICILVLVMGGLKQKTKVLFHFLIRAVLGLTGIYFCNELLEMQSVSVAVGINPISFLTAGTLGISGVALLYGIMFYQTL